MRIVTALVFVVTQICFSVAKGNHIFFLRDNLFSDRNYYLRSLGVQKQVAIDQEKVDTLHFLADYDSATYYYEKGVSLKGSKKYAKAIKFYDSASRMFLKKKKWDEYILAQNSLAWMYYLLDSYDSALQLFHHVLANVEDNKKLVNTYVKMARIYSRMGKHDESIKMVKKGAKYCDISNTQGKHYLSDCYSQLSVEFWYLSQYDSSIFYQKKNISALKLLLHPDYSKMGNSYGNMGLAYWKKGQLHLAKEYYLESLRYFILSQNDRNIGVCYVNLGGVSIELYLFAEAISYFRNAMPYLDKNKYASGILYHNIGECFVNMKQYDSALYYANKALITKTNLLGKNHSAVASTYSTLGTIYTYSNQYELAAKYYAQALEISKANLASNDPNLINLYNHISRHYVERRQYSEALSFLDTAININNIDYHATNYNSLGKIKSKREYLESLSIRAAIYEKTENVKLAKVTYENIINYYDSVMFTANLNMERYFFKEGSRNTSSNLMELYNILNDETDQRKAFDLSEKNKSTILRLLLDEAALKNSLVKDEVNKAEVKLRNDLVEYHSQLAEEFEKEEKDQERINNLESKIFKLNLDKEVLEEELRKKYPKYFNLKYSNETVSIEEIQGEILEENKALIEYFTGDSSIYIFTITKTSFNVNYVLKDSLFELQLAAFRTALHQPNFVNHSKIDYETYITTAHCLYKYLIDPIDSLIQGKDLIIIPDGELALIPFEALLTKKVNNDKIDYQYLPYLLKQNAISYANSATLLFNELKTKDIGQQANASILAFAPEFGKTNEIFESNKDPIRSKLERLHWTEEEVSRLSSYFDTEVYISSRATERNFKMEAGQHNILHIASHGLVDDKNPMYSKIAFTSDKLDTLTDGYLHTFELYNTQLNAEMVVLSACNTGYGKISKGEGVLNLARGFFYAGCKSVVMSLWVANDKSTAKIMIDFYGFLSLEEPKNRALQKSKISYIENHDGLKAHPYYWSQFIISGNTKPLTGLDKTNWYEIMGYLVGFTFILYLAFIVIKRNLSS